MPEENILTRRFGPLAGWQWAAIAAALGGAYILWRRKQAANAAASGTTNGTTTALDSTGSTGIGAAPAPVVIVQQPAQPTPTGPTTPAPSPKPVPRTAPTPKPAGPPAALPPALNWRQFAQDISGLSPQGGTLRTFARVENGRIVGGNVRNGAPVYALTTGKYGPVWQQGFNAKTLPNGTPIATLPQFSNLIVSGKAA